MDDKGYTFTPLALLLMVPVIIFAVSYGDIVNEINSLSALAIGGDVTSNVGITLVKAIQEDTRDAGRNSAFTATSTVINRFQLTIGNNPWLPDSRGYIENNTITLLNNNLTNTCRVLETQTGRNITINGVAVDPNGNNSINIFQNSTPTSPGFVNVTQSDPFGFNITVKGVPVVVTQNKQVSQFTTPDQNVYVSIEGLEDPYIWINTKARNTSVIYHYPNYSPLSKDYHFHDSIDSTGNPSYLKECLIGQNSTIWGPRSYYIVDPHGLSFFDRLEGRTNNTSISPASARMSTFILYDPTVEDHPNQNISCIDHEYFDDITGYPIQTNKAGVGLRTVICPGSGKVFTLSNTYKVYLNLSGVIT
ncbi:hypothetical protein [uncultured Methanobacterium sp.]|uniref:hypothetical protein n=1 Tax=uncultured Methanobacterium sp. TaxID=176306 RepID=UPI002AA6FD5A|nr:hypothetical protein [uncultured Methanobacterium sp.]